ncbi:EAL domain-containing protein [Duganella sp. BJB1802]|uniref:putative bifunctional diguanylate cyclase/phosphodiesterase n=1 Tax=Duganella sp. BJB1802 TaxID=2744575 RepID=UPI0015931E3E|nr:EAL domain-containing protein [Duganella sp. BJB1802]NVD73351.1 EAL domain-containing protein [Duganella sp. BJB1802]
MTHHQRPRATARADGARCDFACITSEGALSAALRPASPGPDGACLDAACAVFDALHEQIAVLAKDGAVLAVNAAWRQSGQVRPLPGQAMLTPDIGSDYLAACREAEGLEEDGGVKAEAGVGAVLAGRSRQFQMEYPSHTASRQRWFRMTVSPMAHNWQGALVVHEDITERHVADADLRIAAIAFESSEGLMVTDSRGVILKVNRAFTRITGYTMAEAVGRTPRMLSSGRHDADFYKAMWAAIAEHGSWAGEIWNRRKNGEVYPEHLSIAAVRDQEGHISNYVAGLSDITLSKAASDAIRTLAFYDPLTRLPNRRMLLERLRQVLDASKLHDRYGALMFIDLDNFKTLNDTLGHNIGDLLLQQVGARLQACLRQGDTVARLGGDEFVVLLEGLGCDEPGAISHAEAVGGKILGELNRPYTLGAHQCHSTPSMGVTLFHDGWPAQPEELLMQADIAMYQAKQTGRNGMRFFDQKMQDSISSRARLEEALRHAILEQQFELYYQVQVDGLGKAIGAEALIRWRLADRSFMAPDSFIPVAEETGLIVPIGQWVMETACAQLRQWHDEPGMAHLVMAVNVSAAQFHQRDFCEQVRAALERHGVDPALLKLELTEGMLLENIEETINIMQQLRHLGVRFSLDDFGTGYSSLQYLKRLPLSQLKIDRSFVRDLASDSSDQAIVLTIIAISRSLGLDVIAEGVETAEQAALLEQSGCHRYQGYLYGRPLPADQFRVWLAKCTGVEERVAIE